MTGRLIGFTSKEVIVCVTIYLNLGSLHGIRTPPRPEQNPKHPAKPHRMNESIVGAHKPRRCCARAGRKRQLSQADERKVRRFVVELRFSSQALLGGFWCCQVEGEGNEDRRKKHNCTLPASLGHETNT